MFFEQGMDLPVSNLRRPRLNRHGVSSVSSPATSYQRSSETKVVRETFGPPSLEVELPGLCEVLNENLSTWNRLFWLLVFITAVLVCLYQSSEVVANVYNDPSITNFRYIRNQSIQFPTVVICPCELNYDFSVVKDPILNLAFLNEHFGNVSADEVLNRLQFGNLKLSELWKFFKLNITHISTSTSDHSEEIVAKYGSYTEYFMISEVYTSLGTCIQLRLKNNVNLYQSGSFIKLKLAGDFPLALVALHQSDELPIKKYLYRRIATVVKGNSLETQYLRLTQVINRNTRKRPCGTGATVSHCLAQCFVNEFVAKETKYLCRLPFMSSFNDIPACNSRAQMETMLSGIHNGTEQFEPSLCDCPRRCLEIMYVLESRHSTYDDTFGIEIHVAEVWITVMEEVAAYNLYKSFSDLGGVIGLWLGICLLEITELLSSCFTKLWLKVKGKKITTPNKNGPRFRIVIARKLNLNKNTNPVLEYPGLNRVLKEDSSLWARILWLVIFVIASVLCINQCLQQIIYYFSDPSTTNIFYTLNETIAFPSVTICPKSNDGLLPAIHPEIVQEILGSSQSNVSVAHLIRYNNFTINDIWNASSIYLFGNPLENEYIQSNWYLQIVPTIFGNCLSFSPRNTSKYIGLQTRQTLSIVGYSEVKLILVHPTEDIALIRYLAQAYARESNDISGWTSERKFRITQVSYRNTWKSPCQERLHVVQCLVKCMEKAIHTKTVQQYCRLPYMDDIDTPTSVCKSEEELYMMVNATLSVIDKFRQEDCLCSAVCQQIIYSTEYIEERIIMSPGSLYVELGVRDNRIMTVEESAAYNGFALFADIGGTLGLFIGLCILNVFEIIGMVYTKIRTLMKRTICCLWKDNNKSSTVTFIRTVVIQELNSTNSTGADYSEVTFPGFFKSADKNSPLWVRALWCVISVGGSILCGYQIMERLQYYISNPTEVRMYYSYNKSITFPLIVICPFLRNSIYRVNEGDMHFLDYWNMSEFLNTFTRVSINEVDDPFGARSSNRFSKQSTPIAYYNTRNNSIRITKESTSAGICLTTEINNPIAYEGHRTSISFDMLLMGPSLSPWVAFFSSDDKRILNYMSNRRTFVESYVVEAKISLQMTEVFRRNTRQNPCTNGEQSAICVTNCFEEEIYSRTKIKCRLPFMKESNTYPLCSTWTDYLDIKQASVEVLDTFDQKKCNCPRNCNEMIYSMEELNIVTGPTDVFQFKLHVPENRIAIIQEEAAYGFIRLLSDLGGLLGLFFGIGILQMFEMVAATATKLCK